jgi:3-mercaptopyruvate sulfurtransferase SseA
MQKTKFILAISFIILVTLACNALLPLPNSDGEPTQIIEPVFTQSQGGIPQTEDDVPRVTVEQAKAAVDAGAAVIVDVRSQEAYETSHIAGALFIPLEDFESNITNLELGKEQWIITYCT